jgi:hypothetical protein
VEIQAGGRVKSVPFLFLGAVASPSPDTVYCSNIDHNGITGNMKKVHTFSVTSKTIGILCALLCLVLLVPSIVFISMFWYHNGPYNPPLETYLALILIPPAISVLVGLGLAKDKKTLLLIAVVLFVIFILVFVYGYYQIKEIPLPSLEHLNI